MSGGEKGKDLPATRREWDVDVDGEKEALGRRRTTKIKGDEGVSGADSGADCHVGLKTQRNNACDARGLSRTSAASSLSPHYLADLSLTRPPPPPLPQTQAYLVSFDSSLCCQSLRAAFVASKCFGRLAVRQMQSSLRSANLEYHPSALTSLKAQHISLYTPSPCHYFLTLSSTSIIY
jgi:hypothetical protein